jgi:site-specific recombinase XerD
MENKFSVAKSNNFFTILGAPIRFTSQLENFLTLCKARGFSEHTLRAYAYDILYFIRWYKIDKNSFKTLNQKILVEFIIFQHKKCSAPASINRRILTIDQFYRFTFGKNISGSITSKFSNAKTQKFLTYDSSIGIFPIKKGNYKNLKIKMTQKQITALEANELRAFFKAIKSKRDLAIVYLMLFCGFRSSEIISLKLGDINRHQSTLRVFGKGKKERVIPLSMDILKIIDDYLRLERPEHSDHDFLFVCLKGIKRNSPLTREGLRSIFRYKRKISGVSSANPHRFRHTFARNMASLGMGLPVLQKILGHNDYRTTIKYINLTNIDVREQYAKAMIELEKNYGKSIY